MPVMVALMGLSSPDGFDTAFDAATIGTMSNPEKSREAVFLQTCIEIYISPALIYVFTVRNRQLQLDLTNTHKAYLSNSIVAADTR
jgi:hypothetical protein